jgi:hypothetical protein
MMISVTDWPMLREFQEAQDRQGIRVAIAMAEKKMAQLRGHDRSAYLRLGLLHARLLRTLAGRMAGKPR